MRLVKLPCGEHHPTISVVVQVTTPRLSPQQHEFTKAIDEVYVSILRHFKLRLERSRHLTGFTSLPGEAACQRHTIPMVQRPEEANATVAAMRQYNVQLPSMTESLPAALYTTSNSP